MTKKELEERVSKLKKERYVLAVGLCDIIVHHKKLNERVHRPLDQSKTMKIAMDALEDANWDGVDARMRP